MQPPNKLMDDLAKVANGAFGAFSGVRNEVEEQIKQRLERYLAEVDLVPREEFDAVREMAIKAREENEHLSERLDVLEKAMKSTGPKKSPQKTTPKTTRAQKG